MKGRAGGGGVSGWGLTAARPRGACRGREGGGGGPTAAAEEDSAVRPRSAAGNLARAGDHVHVAAERSLRHRVWSGVLVHDQAAPVGGPTAGDRRLERAGGIYHLALENVDQQGGELAAHDLGVGRGVAVVQLRPDHLGQGGVDQVPVNFRSGDELNRAGVADGGEGDGAAFSAVGDQIHQLADLVRAVLLKRLTVEPELSAVLVADGAGEIALGHAAVVAAKIPKRGDGLAAGVGLGALRAARAAPARVDVAAGASGAGCAACAACAACPAGRAGHQFVAGIVIAADEASDGEQDDAEDEQGGGGGVGGVAGAVAVLGGDAFHEILRGGVLRPPKIVFPILGMAKLSLYGQIIAVCLELSLLLV